MTAYTRSLSLFKRILLFSICFVLCFLFSCSLAQDRSFIAMDTAMSIRVNGASQDELTQLEQLAHSLEQQLSVTLQDSEISRLNAGESVLLSSDTRDLMKQALSWCEETSGAFDITIYPVVRAWGFTTGDYRVPDEEEIASLLQKVDYARLSLSSDFLTLPTGMMIDLGGAAKGYLTDRMVDYLQTRNYDSALLYLGGNIYCLGTKENGTPWRIGIQDPQDPNSYFAVLSVTDRAVITSGNYERYFEANGVRYGHIFDPSTGYPVEDTILSSTVVTGNATEGDCLSTALIVMGVDQAAEWLQDHPQVEAVLLTSSAVYATSGLKESLVLKNAYKDYSVEWIR